MASSQTVSGYLEQVFLIFSLLRCPSKLMKEINDRSRSVLRCDEERFLSLGFLALQYLVDKSRSLAAALLADGVELRWVDKLCDES